LRDSAQRCSFCAFFARDADVVRPSSPSREPDDDIDKMIYDHARWRTREARLSPRPSAQKMLRRAATCSTDPYAAHA